MKIINNKGYIILLLLFLILKNIIVLLTLNKGFDLIDEGSHMLFYTNPSTYSETFHNYQYYVSLLPQQLIKVPYLRFLYWLLDNLSFAILSFGVYRYVSSHTTFPIQANTLYFFLFTYSAVSLSVHDRIIGYTIINQFLSYSAFGFLFLYLSNNRARFLNVSIVLLSPIFFIKVTTYLFLFLIVACVLIYFRKVASYLKFMASVIISLCLNFFLLCLKNPNWPTDYIQGLRLGKLSGYGSIEMILYVYIFEMVFISIAFLCSIIPFILFKKNILLFKKYFFLWYGLSVFLLVLFFRIFARKEYFVEHYSFSDSQFYYPLLLVFHFIFYLVFSVYISFKTKIDGIFNNQTILIFSMILLPFSLFLGSFSSVTMSFYSYTAPYLIVLFLLVIAKNKDYFNFSATQINFVVVGFSSFLFCLFLLVYVFYPARLLGSLFKQTYRIKEKPEIYVDRELQMFYSNSMNALKNYEDVRRVCYIGNYAGLIYLLDKEQPGTNLYLSFEYYPFFDKMNIAYNQYFYSQYSKQLKESILLIDEGVSTGNLYDNGNGILDFNAHLKVDSIKNPYLAREKSVNEKIIHPYTYVYVPKKITKDK